MNLIMQYLCIIFVSPCQKSLLYECDMKNASVIPNLNDGVLKILQIPGDLAIALWKVSRFYFRMNV